MAQLTALRKVAVSSEEIRLYSLLPFVLISISTRSLVCSSNMEQRSQIQLHLLAFRNRQVCSSWEPDFLESQLV